VPTKFQEITNVGEARSNKSHFCVLKGTHVLCSTQHTGNRFDPRQWYRQTAKTLKRCLSLVWNFHNQPFLRYEWLKTGHVTIAKYKGLKVQTFWRPGYLNFARRSASITFSLWLSFALTDIMIWPM